MKSKPTTTTTSPPPPVLLGDGAADDLDAQAEAYVPSGLRPLDDLILGAVTGELTLIAGAPGQGKTSLAIQWALSASRAGVPVGVLSMEMGRRALLNRLVSGITGIPMPVLRTRRWESGAQRRAAEDAIREIASVPLYVDDRGGLGPTQVYDTLVSWAPLGIKLAVVDYIQQMSGAGDNRVTQVGDAVRAVKAAAKAADLAVIAVSAVNRASALSDNRRPRLSDLRDSGDLEFVADTVLMLHYPEDDYLEDIRSADIYVMKQRNGPTGMASVRFNKPKTTFEEIE